ncbi:sigma 54-interacting transcriptional regulator [Paludibaculum fermentans]|uniref:sigma 54-interacting transcriptional regulator n=1 Tax=Paludibaculum fermentans TaxID=1473598 RepID=UPI003EBA3AB2
MKASVLLGAGWEDDLVDVLWRDAGRAFCKLRRKDAASEIHAFIPLPSSGERPNLETVSRLTHEYELREHLDATWALRPVDFTRERGQPMLVVDYAGGAPLDRLVQQPMEIGQFLRLATALAGVLSRVHGCGLIHKDLKPANVLVDSDSGLVRLTGFGIASRLPRERQSPEPPEFVAGTLAYMAPEQTGRVNRSIDSRSDLYSLGVMFYEMLTGGLPFTASDPMEWVHSHIARQPVAPAERMSRVPVPVSAITMKLLAKTAEERYQTAAGVESDLRHCLSQWESQRLIDNFALGAHDVPDRLMIPEKLYGRDGEINTLLTSFDRVVAGGRPELVLVSGYSGIGKSAVVNELHRPLVPPRGLFASGKFDQYKRDIPYATLAQAFQGLIRPLLSKTDADLGKWRDALREALEPNGQLIVDLVPELKHVIGEQPPVPELPPQEAQRRFQLMFRRFITVFARPEHPLALFLDDLQWLDPATLNLLEDLLTGSDLQHLFLIGAYRDNEVNADHPLMRKLDAIRKAGAAIQEIVLTPLGRDDLGQLLADALHGVAARSAPLAELIHEKTTGNPFFAIQFISTLADEGLLTFDIGERAWIWDLPRIYAKDFTDNVVDLMVGKLNRLPTETQRALQQFACMGNSAEFEMMQMAYPGTAADMHDHLWEAVRSGLIFRADNSYRFLHDRVQEAAYSLIPKEQRAEAHLRIGTLLATRTPPTRLEEAIFEIVNQLNRGKHLVAPAKEREWIADLNLIAGRRAKNATAYDSALKYLRAGSALLTEETWESNYALVFAIEYLMAECELLTADMGAAEDRLSRLVQRTRNRHDFCIVTRLRLTLYTASDQSDRGVAVFLDWLREQGTVWPSHPTRDDAMPEYERIWALLGSRTIEQLVDLPLATDAAFLDTLDVFSEIVTPTLFYDDQLMALVVCRMVSLSLEYGNCDGSCFGYAWFSMLAGPQFNNYKDGYRFGQLGYDLVEKRGLTRYQARTYITFANGVVPWAKHVATERDLVRRAFDLAYRAGDLTFAAYRGEQLVANYLIAGDPLVEVQAEADNGLAFGKRVGFGYVIHVCGSELGLVRTLRGSTAQFGSLNYDEYDELDAERQLAGNPMLSLAEFCYWTRKMQARYFAGDFASAVAAAQQAQRLLWTAPSQIVTADYRFYAALAHAGGLESADTDGKALQMDALAAHHAQLEVWAEHCPANFAERATLVRAEVARIEGRIVDAETLYENAIRLANANGSVHNAAVSNERAGCFYAARGFEGIATTYFRDARSCYRRWGADAKAQQLEQLHPQIGTAGVVPDATATIQTPVEHLDLATVIKVSEAVAGEIVLEKLIDTLMRTAIEHAGAERGLLILPVGDDYRIEAEVTTSSDHLNVVMRQASVTAADLPGSVFQYVLRTKEKVLLHDAGGQNIFASDEYIREHRPRSVLCLPLLKQTRLLGVLYLENRLTPHAFTPARMAVLKLLASGAAMSMENTRLYTDLQEREARISALKDQLYRENLALRDEVDRVSMFEEIVGSSKPLQAALSRITNVAPTDSTVFIFGETGTGKELIARAVHKRSRRSGRAFVSVNCAALAPTLISSELFGHERGAFTGALQRRLGRFELADGGTIFLDEVGELPLDTQVALLRVLQEREFERVGGAQTVRVDVRVITATNRDLTAAVANGSFRQDLFYRLNVFPIEVPPLRERADDIQMLVEYFVQIFATRSGKRFNSIDKKTLELLQHYDWPGNIRELQNVIERSVIVGAGEVFAVDPAWLATRTAQPRPRVAAPALPPSQPRGERETIEAALAECRGRVAGRLGAAARLGVPPSTLDHRIKALGISKTDFKFR